MAFVLWKKEKREREKKMSEQRTCILRRYVARYCICWTRIRKEGEIWNGRDTMLVHL